jgi:hypothetical protein
MRACHGDNSQPAIRADETAAALQRLKWELEQTNMKAGMQLGNHNERLVLIPR